MAFEGAELQKKKERNGTTDLGSSILNAQPSVDVKTEVFASTRST